MSRQESSREAVLQLMRDGVERTDREIAELTGLVAGKASGARNTLWEQGLVEPVPKQSKEEHTRWRLCPPERQAEERRAWRDNRERRTLGRLMQKSAGEQANIAVHLLADDKVNEALLEQLDRSRAWRRARARSREIERERKAEDKQRRADLRRAMDEADTDLRFRQTVSRLRDLQDVLYALDREVEAERARRLNGSEIRVGVAHWEGVAKNVREVLEAGQGLFRDLADLMGKPMDSCPLCGERLHSPSGNLDEGYIDAVVVEETDVEST